MKKLAFLFAIVAGFLLSSCTNDEIEITSVNKLTLNVKTQGVYDTFGSTKSIKERFLAESSQIGVYAFIYDKEGKLAASDSTYSNTFNQQKLDFSLPSGDYTLVTLQMLVDKDNKNLSDNWIINGKNSLSTLEVAQKTMTAYWYSVLGSSSMKLTVKEDQPASYNLENKAMGCVVDFNALNFNKTSKYNTLFFCTKDAPEARRLSPDYSGDSRFRYESYTGERTWNVRGYDLKSSGFEAAESFDVYLIEEGRINYCVAPSYSTRNSNGGYTFGRFTCYPSDKSYYNVSDGSRYYSGLAWLGANATPECSAMIGDVAAYNSWVNGLGGVTPDPTPAGTYVAPYLNWGASATAVKNYMTGKGVTDIEEGVDKSDNNTYLVLCNSADGAVYYQYSFTNPAKTLKDLLMTFTASKFSLDRIRKDMSEDFEGGEYDDDLEGYLYYNNQTIALVSEVEYEGTPEIWVQYIPATSSARKMMRTDAKGFKAMVKAHKQNILKK